MSYCKYNYTPAIVYPGTARHEATGMPKVKFALGGDILRAGQTDCTSTVPCSSQDTQNPGKMENMQ